MNEVDINSILGREQNKELIRNVLIEFEKNKYDVMSKKGIYVYGASGVGKTHFVNEILRELNYDIVKYDAGDIRNKSVIDALSKHTMSDKNVIGMFSKKVNRIAIIMDEIDGMNNGDKGGINSLIKLIRPKKTKKQKKEEITFNPIICISNYHVDKKIKELMKVCTVVDLTQPTFTQTHNLMTLLFKNIDDKRTLTEPRTINNPLNDGTIEFIQGDLRKVQIVCDMYSANNNVFFNNIGTDVCRLKSSNSGTKILVKKFINTSYSIMEHNEVMNDADRTIIALLWHENIIDVLETSKKHTSVPFYLKMLDNMCFADNIDRITFQKQIWQFNEMSSLIKTFYNNNLLHNTFKKCIFEPSEIRFTKVLTKYSTEYNNLMFVQNLCNQLGMEMKDMLSFFMYMKKTHSDTDILPLFSNCEITKLDIQRIYKYIDKYIKDSVDVSKPGDDCDYDDDMSIINCGELS